MLNVFGLFYSLYSLFSPLLLSNFAELDFWKYTARQDQERSWGCLSPTWLCLCGFGHCHQPSFPGVSLPPPKHAPGCEISSPAPPLPKDHPKKPKTQICILFHVLGLCLLHLAVAHGIVWSLDTPWSDEGFVDDWCYQGLALLGTGNGECSHSPVMMGGTEKQTGQAVSKQQSLKAGVFNLTYMNKLNEYLQTKNCFRTA